MKITDDIECGNCRSRLTYEAGPGVLWCSDCGAVQDSHSPYFPHHWQPPNNPRARDHAGGVGEYVFVLEPVSPGVGRVVAQGDCTGMSAKLGDLVYYRAGDEADCGRGQVAIQKGGILRWETPAEPAFRWGLVERNGTWHAWVSCGGLEKTVDLGVVKIGPIRLTQTEVSGGHVFNFRTESGGSAAISFDEDEVRP